MLQRGLCRLALAGLVLLGLQVGFFRPHQASAQTAGETAFKPAVVIRLAPLDDLIADGRYLAKQLGRAELARQVEALVKARTGPKGLEGIDTKKPIGLYGAVASRIDLSEGVLLLPIADESAFLEFLDVLEYKPKKDDSGLYTIKIDPIPFPIQFRFAHGYLYGTLKFTEQASLPDKDKLPLPAAVLSAGSGLLSVTANIDRIPLQIRKIGVSAAALTLGNMKEEPVENATDADLEVRSALLDEAAMQVKSLLLDGGAVQFKIDVDRKKHDLSLSASLDAKPNSPLAATLTALGARKSLAASLAGKDAAMGGFLHAGLPAAVRKALGPAVDVRVKKVLDLLDQDTRDLLAPLAAAVTPTLKDGTLDVGVTMRGPGKSGKYTLVGSLQVTDGQTIEKAIKKMAGKLPEGAKNPFTFDVAKVGGVAIHRVEQEHVAESAKELFGDGPLYFAFRKDALLFTTGDDAQATLESCLDVKPKAGKLLQLDLSLARIAKLLAIQHPTAPAAAKQVFTHKGSDKVRLTLEVDGKLELKLHIKTAALAFAALLDKARREAAAAK